MMIQLRRREGYEFERAWVPVDNLVFNDFEQLKKYYNLRYLFEENKPELVLNPRESESVFKYEDEEKDFDQVVIDNVEKYYDREMYDILRYFDLCVTVYLTKGD